MEGKPGQGASSPPLLTLAYQYVRFGVVGLVATAVHVGFFVLLIEWLTVRPLSANVVAFCIAVLVSYLGNFHWTFRADAQTLDKDDCRQPIIFLKFAVVAVTGLLLNTLAVYMVMEVLQLPYGYALIVMVGLVPIVVFLLNKFWAFRTG